MTEMNKQRNDRFIASWLLFCAAIIVAMILLGGVTRLTHSGLSMVEWKPLMGVIPPIGDQAWQTTFDKYKQFPEYQKANQGMGLAEFKSIFLFEYAHRILGRLIGLVFLIPFLYFKFTGRIRPALTPKLITLFVLGGLQGLLGWYMVKSGLVDNPMVSQYRLTAHLGMAVLIYGYMLWVAFELIFSSSDQLSGTVSRNLSRFSKLLVGLLFFMILSGGMVAGTRAGLIYNTFPLMGDTFIPSGLYTMEPFWLSAFEDLTTIQFNHRMFAYTLFMLITGFSILLFRSGVQTRVHYGVHALLVFLLLQITLGISTLLQHVPVAIAAAHQGGAICLFTAALFVSHALSVNSKGALS